MEDELHIERYVAFVHRACGKLILCPELEQKEAFG